MLKLTAHHQLENVDFGLAFSLIISVIVEGRDVGCCKRLYYLFGVLLVS